MKKIFFATALCFVFFINFLGIAYASDLTSSEIASNSSQDVSINNSDSVDAQFNPVKNGISTNDSNNSINYTDDSDFATVDFYLELVIPSLTTYEVKCKIVSTTFVQCTKGNLLIKNASITNSTKYYDNYVTINFPSTCYYCEEQGTIQIPKSVTGVNISYTNTLMYFNEYGWCSGKTLYGYQALH